MVDGGDHHKDVVLHQVGHKVHPVETLDLAEREDVVRHRQVGPPVFFNLRLQVFIVVVGVQGSMLELWHDRYGEAKDHVEWDC